MDLLVVSRGELAPVEVPPVGDPDSQQRAADPKADHEQRLARRVRVEIDLGAERVNCSGIGRSRCYLAVALGQHRNWHRRSVECVADDQQYARADCRTGQPK